jgi:hypothetical protein
MLSCRTALFARQRQLIGRVTPMQLQRPFERALIAGNGCVLAITLMSPGTITSIDRAVAVEEHRREGQIVIELKPGEVQRIGVDHAHADELVEQRGKVLFGTLQDLGINSRAGEARHATQHHHQWLAGAFRLPEAAFKVVVNPTFVLLHRGAVLAHGALTIFDGFGLGKQNGRGEGKREQRRAFHELIDAGSREE